MKPTKSLLQGMPYTPSYRTNIRETFKRAAGSHVIAFHGAMKPLPDGAGRIAFIRDDQIKLRSDSK